MIIALFKNETAKNSNIRIAGGLHCLVATDMNSIGGNSRKHNTHLRDSAVCD